MIKSGADSFAKVDANKNLQAVASWEYLHILCIFKNILHISIEFP